MAATAVVDSNVRILGLAAQAVGLVFENLGLLSRSLRSDLLLPHGCVVAVALDEFLMCAALLYSSFVEYKDLVGVGDGAQAMSNDEHGASFGQFRKRFLDVLLCFGV